jgi:hypothetical protein
MMTSVSGERGIGKTYHLAKEVYEHYHRGFLTITNFRHLTSHITCHNRPDMLIEMIKQLGEFKSRGYELCDLLPTFKHTGVFMAIDEAHLVFGADQWKRYGSDPSFQFVIQFLAQARKQDVNIWYSTQDPAKIDKNWRRYTDDWIRYTAVIPLKRHVLVPHPTRPIYRREIRYIIPLIWEELHRLDQDNPSFNYAKHTVEGWSEWAKSATLIHRKMRLSGWLDPFPYKLYDSHEMIGLKANDEVSDFKMLKDIAYIPDTIYREGLPTFKRVLRSLGLPGMTPNDEKIPSRIRFKKLELPLGVTPDVTAGTLKQPEEFLDDLSFFNKHPNVSRLTRRRIQHTTKPTNSPPTPCQPLAEASL